MLTANNLRSLGQPAMDPSRLFGKRGLLRVVDRLDREWDVVQGGLLEGLWIAVPVG
jgi:hypothetical protein